MTQDVQRHHDDQDLATEDEVYAALWATVPLPRLPRDAPDALKKVAIDIDDPKRVYAIHQAARRHHFQILVERYIFQIRYGCTSKTCNTSTCFSSRKRAAGGAPVRRYNATSARTLAVYMATQDNPEQGLCHHPSADRPIPPSDKPSKPKKNANGVVRTNASERPTSPDRRMESAKEAKPNPLGSNKTKKRIKREKTIREEPERHAQRPQETLDEPTATDHRSFVQNVFGTTAFKMLEWLTPRSLEILSRPEEIMKPAELEDSKPASEKPRKKEDSNNAPSKTTDALPKTKQDPGPDIGAKVSRSKSSINSNNVPIIADAKPPARTVSTQKPSLKGHQKAHSGDNPPQKGILNIPSRTTDNAVDMSLPQFRPSNPKQKLSRQPSITSPQIQVAEITSMASGKPASVKIITESKKPTPKGRKDEKPKDESIPTAKPNVEQAKPNPEVQEPKPTNTPSPPQSVSHLPIDLINFLCDTLQIDGSSERHDLKPEYITPDMVKCQTSYQKNQNPVRKKFKDLEGWQIFIHQSFFDVLSNPDSLLRSFRDEKGQLFDTHTIWYLLLRMTRVAPSIVYHSLWNVAGTLFNPPEKLQMLHDWTKDASSTPSSNSLSNSESADVMSICLHALVATTPLVSNARQLANMSRIRSYGLTMLGRESSSLEPAALCLEYEDAFTNDLVLRLARRVFASIPTRRRFSELMEVQNDPRNDEEREPDVLEEVLAKLKFLDLETTAPVLTFSLEERDLHEKRVPTLLLDWARTVMLQDWQGSAEVSSEGAFGGALALIAAIYKHRKSLLLGDIHFRTEYFAERLDPIAMPIEWAQFETNKRTVHLLDYPYLFTPATLITYFRAVNYSRMNRAYEIAKSVGGLMRSIDMDNRLIPDQSAQHRLVDRMQTGMACFMVLEISRENVLEDTFNAIWRREEREIMRPLKIRLGEEGGEEGMDSGGVQQEFFRLAIAEALNPDYGTFTIDNRTKMTWFQPGSPEPLWKFELIGLIVSLAVYNGLTLPVTFPKALYQKLLDEEVTELHHIADGWPDLANGLTTLLEWDEKDGLVEDIFARTYEFSVSQFGQPVSVEMTSPLSTHWPQFSDPHSSINPVDAPMVTNANRNAYVSDYIRFLTDISIRPQFSAFKAGFFACLDRRSLSLFTPETLQSLVEGVQDIDVAELRRATRYIGWDASHHTVRDFWSIVKRYDLEQKKRLLEFVTASDRVPVGGMRNLQFTLQRNGGDGQLPSSYTCFGILLLPEYSGKEVLREKLGIALENSKGFGFS